MLNQALMATTPGIKGWYVRTGGGDGWISPGTPGATADAPLGEATWKVVAGLADRTATRSSPPVTSGSYLRQNNYRVRRAQ